MSRLEVDYRALFDETPTPYLVLTPQLVIAGMNKARERVTGTRRQDIIGRDIFEVFTDDTEDPTATGVENLRRSLQRVLVSKKPDTMPLQKYALPEPGSRRFVERWWSPLNVPILDADGHVVLLLHRVTDVTEWVSARASADTPSSAALQECDADLFARAHELHAAWLEATTDLEHYRRALQTQRTIGQAVGLLMARADVDADTAFKLLVRQSQHRNMKLRDIAEEQVARRAARATQ